jgi:hypothetical protein
MGNIGKRVKELYCKCSEESFRVLTFGELKIGDEYIALPLPGDNEGHGGFRGSYNLFRKIKDEYRLDPVTPVNNTERVRDSVFKNMESNLLVIKVE